MNGTHAANRLEEDGTPGAVGPAGTLLAKRRRWESNPLETGLQPVAWPFGSSVKYPRQESNLIPDRRRVVCDPPHPEDESIPARIRTGIQTLEESDVDPLHHQDIQEPTAGFAPA